MQFQELIGQKIFVVTNISALEKLKIHGNTAVAELTGVECGGIWVKHDGLAKDLGRWQETGLGFIAGRDPDVEGHIFLPFSSIVFASALSPVLNEGKLGLG